jgi:probable HAF family extracellular repeat protein
MKPNIAKVLVLSMVVAIFFVAKPVSTYGSAGELTIIDLGVNSYGNPLAINQRGQVIGTSDGLSFLWEKGTKTGLGLQGGGCNGAEAINNHGQIVVTGSTSGEWPFDVFLWEKGTNTDLGLGADFWNCGTGLSYFINNNGQVAGSMSFGPSDHAFLWENGTLTDLGTLGGVSSLATAMNEAGQIVGFSSIGEESHAFLWEAGTMIDLGTLGSDFTYPRDINERGQVVGYGNIPPWGADLHGFIWENGTMTDLGTLGGSEAVASAINNHGQVVGGSGTSYCAYNSDGEWICAWHAFLWEAGTIIDLGTLWKVPDDDPDNVKYNTYSSAHAINEGGEIVGLSKTASGEYHAFLWKNGKMTDLGTLEGCSETYPLAINERGEIAGQCWMSSLSEYHNVLWTK